MHLYIICLISGVSHDDRNKKISFGELDPSQGFGIRQSRSIILLVQFNPWSYTFSSSIPPLVWIWLSVLVRNMCAQEGEPGTSSKKINLFLTKLLNLLKHIALIISIVCVLSFEKRKAMKRFFFFLCMYFSKHALFLKHCMN